MGKPDSYHHGDLARALVDAALRIARAQGAGAVTLRRVARDAGVSHAAPYHHFADRAALVAAVGEVGFRELADSVRAGVEGIGDARERLREAGIAYVLFAVRDPELFRLMFSREIADTAPYPGLNAAARAAKETLETAVGARSRPVAAYESAGFEDRVRAAWALAHGLAVLIIDGQFGPAAMTRGGAAKVSRAAMDTVAPPGS